MNQIIVIVLPGGKAPSDIASEWVTVVLLVLRDVPGDNKALKSESEKCRESIRCLDRQTRGSSQ